MATKFKFEIESDGLTTAQSIAFSAFVNSLSAQTIASSAFVNSLNAQTAAPVKDFIPQESADVEEVVKHDTPQKKKRAPKLDIKAGSGNIEDTEADQDKEERIFRAQELADREAQELADRNAKGAASLKLLNA